jgi:hypothetical protein
MKPRALAIVALSLGCRSPTHRGDAAVDVPAPTPVWAYAHPRVEIGAPCAGPTTTLPQLPRTGGAIICGTDSKVAGGYGPVDELVLSRDAPPPRVVASAETPPTFMSNPKIVRVRGPFLEIVAYTCHMCRRMLGWYFVGLPERLAPQLAIDLQRALGAAPLQAARTIDDWGKLRFLTTEESFPMHLHQP